MPTDQDHTIRYIQAMNEREQTDDNDYADSGI